MADDGDIESSSSQNPNLAPDHGATKAGVHAEDQISNAQVIVEGLLYKQKSGPIKAWDERWFRLIGLGLYYYKTGFRPLGNSKPTGFVNIAEGKYFRPATVNVKVDGKLLEHAIEIRLEKRKYVLLCVDVDTRNKWLRGLTKWQKLQREGAFEVKAKGNNLNGGEAADEGEYSVSKSKSKYSGDADELSKFSKTEMTAATTAHLPINKFRDVSEELAAIHFNLDKIQAKMKNADDALAEKVYLELTKMVSKAFDGKFDLHLTSSDGDIPSKNQTHSAPDTQSDEEILSKAYADYAAQRREIHNNVFLHFKNKKYRAFLLELVSNNYALALELCDKVENSDFEIMAKALIDWLDLMNEIRPFLKLVLEAVVADTPTVGVLFRESTVQTRMLSYYMQMEGAQYLRNMLFEFVRDVIAHEGISCEINVSKLIDPSEVEQNARHLTNYTETVLEKILESANDAPNSLRVLARHLRDAAVSKFPDASYNSIGGLLFLRFICPAILFPQEAGLIIETSSSRASRNFVLIAKIVQNLGNGVEFGAKEDYMMCMNVIVKKYLVRVQKFFEEFANPPIQAFDEIEYKNVDKGEVDACMSELEFLIKMSSQMKDPSSFGNDARKMDKYKPSVTEVKPNESDNKPPRTIGLEDIKNVLSNMVSMVDPLPIVAKITKSTRPAEQHKRSFSGPANSSSVQITVQENKSEEITEADHEEDNLRDRSSRKGKKLPSLPTKSPDVDFLSSKSFTKQLPNLPQPRAAESHGHFDTLSIPSTSSLDVDFLSSNSSTKELPDLPLQRPAQPHAHSENLSFSVVSSSGVDLFSSKSFTKKIPDLRPQRRAPASHAHSDMTEESSVVRQKSSLKESTSSKTIHERFNVKANLSSSNDASVSTNPNSTPAPPMIPVGRYGHSGKATENPSFSDTSSLLKPGISTENGFGKHSPVQAAVSQKQMNY